MGNRRCGRRGIGMFTARSSRSSSLSQRGEGARAAKRCEGARPCALGLALPGPNRGLLKPHRGPAHGHSAQGCDISEHIGFYVEPVEQAKVCVYRSIAMMSWGRVPPEVSGR